MLKIKNILNDLVDKAYKDSKNLERYKKFFIEVNNKDYSSKHGDYYGREHKIRIFNLYRDPAAITVTTIHELAHHIEYVDMGNTGHQEGFYSRYTKLLYNALDMGLVNKQDILSATKDASGHDKVIKIVNNYHPRSADYKADQAIVQVLNGYEKRDQLKAVGYYWNNIEQVWEKEIIKEASQKEQSFLFQLNLKCRISNAAAMYTTSKQRYLCAGKGSFEHKDALVALGFHFESKEKAWALPIPGDEKEDHFSNRFKKQFPSIRWDIKTQ